MNAGKAIRRVAWVLMVLVLALGAGEMYLRAAGRCTTWSERSYGVYAPMAECLPSWLSAREPNRKGWYDNREFRFALDTNSLGVRDREHPREKPAGEFRVAVLGDSFTEGVGAAFEDAWFRKLEALLNARARPGIRFSVISGAVAGSDPFYSFQMLAQRLLAWRPDLVILALGENDVVDVARRGGMERFRPDGTVRVPSPVPAEWLFRRSRLYRYVFLGILGRNENLVDPVRFEGMEARAREELFALVPQFGDLCRKRGAAFVAVAYPQGYEVGTGEYLPKFSPLVRRLESSGERVMNLLPSFLRAVEHGVAPGDLYWPVDRHYNARGYEIFARAVADGLAREGLAPVSP